MAVIGSIRKRGTLLLVVIGVSMLAFILGELIPRLASNSSQTAVAYIDGQEVHVNDFSMLYNRVVNDFQMSNPSVEMDQDLQQQLSNQTWKQLKDTLIFHPEYQKAGLRVTLAELKDMLTGKTVHPLIIQYFTDPSTGQFNPDQVASFNNQFANPPAEMDPEQERSFYQARSQWAGLQEAIREDRLSGKYLNLIEKAVYVPSGMAKRQYHEGSDNLTGAYVFRSYFSLPDTAVTVTDEDIKAQFRNETWKYTMEPGRSIQYAAFPAIPTPGDSALLRNDLLGLQAEFATTENDTLFSVSNSDDKYANPQYYAENTLPASFDSLLFNAENGTIAGPVVESGQFVLAKKVAERLEPDSMYMHHIFLQPTSQEEVEAKRALRDSLVDLLDAGADFWTLSKQYSELPEAARDSGNLGWISRKMPEVPEFLDSAYLAIERPYIAANSSGGFHILKQTRYSEAKKKVLVAQIVREIEPSKETRDAAFKKASEFASEAGIENTDAVLYFEKAQRLGKASIRPEDIDPSSRSLRGLDESGEIARWALQNQTGAVSPVLSAGNTFVVCLVSNIRNRQPSLEDVYYSVRQDAIRNKKAEKFEEEMKAAMASSSSIDQVASALSLTVSTLENIPANGFIPELGMEQNLVGHLFGAPFNALQGPIRGNAGVFVAVTNQRNIAPDLPDYQQQRAQMSGQLRMAIPRAAVTAVENAYRVEDQRYKFPSF